MKNWIKKGLIYKPDGNIEWSKTHAQVPVADITKDGNAIKVYFSTRDNHHRSRPGYVILDIDNPKKILDISEKPILELGELGTFDDCGVMPSWIADTNGDKYLYYIGWNVRNTIPYHNAVGLAISKDGGDTFQKFSNGPLWDRNYLEPHYSGTSCVLQIDGLWHNWYLSCTEWKIMNGRSEPRYHIKYAHSIDGINWVREGRIAIDYKDNNEAGIVKASVIKEKGSYKMWYSYRNFDNYRENTANSYKIGFATSKDGINWSREDENAGIFVDKNGWDSIMMAYPHVIKVKNKLLMFYNGNGFGQSGFGYAELDDE
ncbi:MAG: hypothetical protein NXI20_25530 [bacterium]|nr:hypothetical protein [bacterium]